MKQRLKAHRVIKDRAKNVPTEWGMLLVIIRIQIMLFSIKGLSLLSSFFYFQGVDAYDCDIYLLREVQM